MTKNRLSLGKAANARANLCGIFADCSPMDTQKDFRTTMILQPLVAYQNHELTR
jgi:hypothetical protein